MSAILTPGRAPFSSVAALMRMLMGLFPPVMWCCIAAANGPCMQDPFVEPRGRHVFASPPRLSLTSAAGDDVQATVIVPTPRLGSMGGTSKSGEAGAGGAAAAVGEALKPQGSDDEQGSEEAEQSVRPGHDFLFPILYIWTKHPRYLDVLHPF